MTRAQYRVFIATLVLTAFSVVLAGCGRGTVAKVNGRRISRAEYYDRLERLPFTDPRTGQRVEAGAYVLGRLIDEVLVLKLAEQEKVPPTEEQVENRTAEFQKQPAFAAGLRASGLSKDQIKELMRVDQAFFNLQTKGVKVTEEEIKEAYEANKNTQFTTPEQLEVAAIFAENKKSADRAMSMLAKGIAFGTVAREISSDRKSAENEGRLPNPIIRGDRRIPESVQNIVFNTPKGKYTQPIFDGKGYVIFKILDHQKQTTRKLKDVRYIIWQQLMLNKGAKKNPDVQEQLDKLRQKSDISVNIERYRRFLESPKPSAKKSKE